jgi:hypothetical protein
LDGEHGPFDLADILPVLGSLEFGLGFELKRGVLLVEVDPVALRAFGPVLVPVEPEVKDRFSDAVGLELLDEVAVGAREQAPTVMMSPIAYSSDGMISTRPPVLITGSIESDSTLRTSI